MDLNLANEFYQKMLLIRRFEEKCIELYGKEKIRGFLHLYIGQEAIGVGLMHALSPEDAIFTTYRDHGHAIARGIDPKKIMAELYGKVQGCSHGRGGSMHLFDIATRFYGGSAIVASGLPLAVGMALSDKLMKRNRVTVCIFGDGAVAEGEFHESLNLAALWHLPVLFVCENNLYAMGSALEFTQSETNLAKKAASYRISSRQADGMDVTEVAKSAQEAVAEIRLGNGPIFIEYFTYRFRAHSMYDAELYREKTEVAEWKKKDSLILLHQHWQDIDIDKYETEVADTINEAVTFAENGTFEPIEDLEKFVYSSEVVQ